MKTGIRLSFLLLALVSSLSAPAQTKISYNLAELLQQNQIATSAYSEARSLNDSKPGAISCVHPVLFKDISFSEGTIDIDLRGKYATRFARWTALGKHLA